MLASFGISGGYSGPGWDEQPPPAAPQAVARRGRRAPPGSAPSRMVRCSSSRIYSQRAPDGRCPSVHSPSGQPRPVPPEQISTVALPSGWPGGTPLPPPPPHRPLPCSVPRPPYPSSMCSYAHPLIQKSPGPDTTQGASGRPLLPGHSSSQTGQCQSASSGRSGVAPEMHVPAGDDEAPALSGPSYP